MMNKLAHEIATWREGVASGPRDDRLLASLMGVVTEISEAAEDVRHGRMDHLPEELADAIIRILGICGRLGIDISSAVIAKMERNMEV